MLAQTGMPQMTTAAEIAFESDISSISETSFIIDDLSFEGAIDIYPIF